jgi:glycine cleavage system regulatory protein
LVFRLCLLALAHSAWNLRVRVVERTGVVQGEAFTMNESTCWSGQPDYVERLEAEIARLQAEKNLAVAMLESAAKECNELRAALEEIADDSKLSISKGRLSWAVDIARKALAKE